MQQNNSLVLLGKFREKLGISRVTFAKQSRCAKLLVDSIERGEMSPPPRALLAYERIAIDASLSHPIISTRLLSLVTRLKETILKKESQSQTNTENAVTTLSRQDAIKSVMQKQGLWKIPDKKAVKQFSNTQSVKKIKRAPKFTPQNKHIKNRSNLANPSLRQENSKENEHLLSANELIMRRHKLKAAGKKKSEKIPKRFPSKLPEMQSKEVLKEKKKSEIKNLTQREVVPVEIELPTYQPDTSIDPWISDLLSILSFQTDTLQETAHQLAANAHAGLIFKDAAAQLDTMRNIARTILQDVVRWEDACVRCERPPLNKGLSIAVKDLKSYIDDFPNAGNITRDDPRLSVYIKSIFAIYDDATTLSELISYLIQRTRDPKSSEDATSNLSALLVQLKALSTLSLEEELEQFLQIVLSEKVDKRSFEIATERFGVRGHRKTLQELASDFNVSRERIRQLVKPYEKPFEELIGSHPFTPAFDKVTQFIVSWAPGPVGELLKELVRQDLTTFPWNAKTLTYWIQLLGRMDQFSFVEVHQYPKGNIVYIECSKQKNAVSTDDGYLDQIIHIARRQVSRWGVASVEDIVSKLQSDESLNAPHISIDSQTLQRLLPTQFDFSWLDKDCNWFWFSKSERGGKYWNGLLTQVKKIFAVTNEIQIGELRRGVARDIRREGFAPPRAVLLELCRQLPWLRVEGETIRLTNKSEVEDSLSTTESILYRALQCNDFIMSRRDLEKICFANGMSEPTLDVRLGASPIIVRHATSVYGLCGHHVKPGKVEEVIAKTRYENKGRARVLQDYGWKDGHIWIGYKVSKGSINGVCSLPAGLKTFLKGEFQLQTFDRMPMGTLVYGENQAWGIGSFLRRRGGEIGDYFLLLINLQTRIARIKLGDESILDDYQ